MKSTEFITEREVTPYQSEELEIERARETMNKYCTEAFPMLKNPIWRGMTGSAKVIMINPATGVRKSQNTANFYTDLVDSSPFMAGWPKRSSSLICSTSRDYAGSYQWGEKSLYAIFPMDGTKIAMCSDRDMWDTNVSIPELRKNFTGTGNNMSRFNDWLSDLNLNDNPGWMETAHKSPYVIDECEEYGQDPKNFISILHKALSPKNAGFQLLTVPEYIATNLPQSDYGREVWIGGKVIAIRYTLWSEMVGDHDNDWMYA